MKKTKIFCLLIATFLISSCTKSLEERKADWNKCAKSYFEKQGPIYKNDQQLLFNDMCKHFKVETDQCDGFIINLIMSNKIQDAVNTFAVEKAEEICGEVPKK